MATLLIALIYLAFVSMGLPDSLLGSAWPSLYPAFGVPVSYAGLVTALITAGTVVSSLLSDRFIRRFGTGLVTFFSTFLTAVALFGFSFSFRFWHLLLWALPYGLGAGCIDATLNNYVALKYKAREMSWIHFFWGFGATLGPFIMGSLLAGGASWTQGYRTVGYVQAGMTVCLLAAIPVFRKNALPEPAGSSASGRAGRVLRLPGVPAALLACLCYCAVEVTAGLWASSYMTLNRGVPAAEAARWTSIFLLGITIGRFLQGFIADRVGDRNMIRMGLALIFAGIALLIVPLGNLTCFLGLILTGLGCAPIYPSILHATPRHFGVENSQAVIGLQMACAYTGSALVPPLFGLIADKISISLLPFYLLLFTVLMTIATESINRAMDAKGRA